MQQAAVIETTSFSSLTLEWELQLGNSERVLSVKEREREREREGEREREYHKNNQKSGFTKPIHENSPTIRPANSHEHSQADTNVNEHTLEHKHRVRQIHEQIMKENLHLLTIF